MKIEVWIDGLCEPVNPGGIACYGIIIETPSRIVKLYDCVGEGPGMSNNVGEYAGLIRALEYLYKCGLQDEEIVIHSDSQLLVKQMSGQWRIRGGLYVMFALKARELLKFFKNVRFEWIPREENKMADFLAHKAYLERRR